MEKKPREMHRMSAITANSLPQDDPFNKATVLLRGKASDPATLALLVEQRRTNRLLQALLYAAVGFVGGVLATQILLH